MMAAMNQTVVDEVRRPRHATKTNRVILAVAFIALLCGSTTMALRESASASVVPGTLVSVDKRDGGQSGTGVVTVNYLDGSGQLATADVVMTFSDWPSLDPGTPISVYVRDGRAVDEPEPLLQNLATALLQAVAVWLVVLLTVIGMGE